MKHYLSHDSQRLLSDALKLWTMVSDGNEKLEISKVKSEGEGENFMIGHLIDRVLIEVAKPLR